MLLIGKHAWPVATGRFINDKLIPTFDDQFADQAAGRTREGQQLMQTLSLVEKSVDKFPPIYNCFYNSCCIWVIVYRIVGKKEKVKDKRFKG